MAANAYFCPKSKDLYLLPRKKLDRSCCFSYNGKVRIFSESEVEKMLEKLFYLTKLFDMYAMLLKEKQRRCLKLHLFDDFSLSEVGEAVGMSRQAAYDMIHRSIKTLEGYEKKLGLLRRLSEEYEELIAIEEAIKALRTKETGVAVDAILKRMSRLLGRDWR